jgi:hypothetical protein
MAGEGTERAQQHRDAEDRTELLGLTGAGANTRPRRDHNDPDVRLRDGG